MSTDRDTTRIVRSWLRTDGNESADRVLGAVLDRLDATPQRRHTWWPARRLSTMNTTLKFGLAAAVVAVAALIGINYLAEPSVGGPGPAEPTPIATPTPEPSLAEQSSAAEGELTAGDTFSLSLPEYPIAIKVIIPAAGWWGDPTGGVLVREDAEPPSGAGIITFADDGYYVYGDPCQWSTTRPDTPSTTVDQLVAALSAQASRDASAPVDITLDGYAGKAITLHVPADADFAECDEETFSSWGVAGEDPARYHQGPGQTDELWILDVDGHLVVIDWSYYEGTPQAAVDELRQIVESARFETP